MKKLSTTNYKLKTGKHGFTLIEMMVAVSLFSVVMLVSVGSLLSLIDASKRAQAIQSIMNNTNIALDGMVRALRMGQNYERVNDTRIEFTPFDRPGETWAYYFSETNPLDSEPRGKLYKEYKPDGFTVSVTVPLTAEEVDIDSVTFYVTGVGSGDNIQPRILIIIKGKAGFSKQKTVTTFNIQASATQRLLDL